MGKKTIATLIIFLILFSGTCVYAQESPKSKEFYNSNVLYYESTFWTGENVVQGLMRYKVTMFGGSPQMVALISQSPLAVVEITGERCWEAELYRLRGELLLMKGEEGSEVEASFHHALDVARRQSARSLELRAATSLCHLWQKQGKREEARQTLAEIYGWFREGFDTADLREAKALLDELTLPKPV